MLIKLNIFLPFLPEIVLFLNSLLLVIAGVFTGNRFTSQISRLSVLILFTVLIISLQLWYSGNHLVKNNFAIVQDYIFWSKIFITVLSMILLAILVSISRSNLTYKIFELPILILLAVLGMFVMMSANNFLTLYMGIELQSLCLYVLAASGKNDSKSSEAGLKYFVLGSLASGIMLFGISLIYGFTGTVNFTKLYELYTNKFILVQHLPIGVLVGIILLIIGILFKMAAAPFHMWSPDIYEGSPTFITAFFAIVPKVAMILLFLRLFEYPLSGIQYSLNKIFILVSILSMFIGSIAAIRQSNIKRLLAYSSISHIGFILIGFAAFESMDAFNAIITYIIIYSIMNIGAFSFLFLIESNKGFAENIEDLAGLAKNSPMLALGFSLILFSMVGIPPFAGFFAKFYIFTSALDQKLYSLVILGVISSIISAFYCLRMVKTMYFDEGVVELKDCNKFIAIIAMIASIINVFFFFFPPLIRIGFASILKFNLF